MSRTAKPRKHRPLIEELEPRILYSADFSGAVVDAGGESQTAEERTVGEDAAETNAETEALSSPLVFEHNEGQVDAAVDFMARGSAQTVYLSHGDAIIDMRNADGGGNVVELNVVGARADAPVSGEHLLETQSNYLIGSQDQWHTGVDNFGSVLYSSIYNGVDLRYHGNGSRLEYDFIVSPGASVDSIQLSFEGVLSKSIDADGNLVLTLDETGRTIAFQAPVSYQLAADGSHEAVDSRYEILADGTVGFHVGAYDSTRDLVIDPTLSWSTYLGSTGGEQASAVAVDASGNVYVTGNTSGSFPASAGAYDTAASGGYDAFITKFDSTGARVYSTYYGGSGDDLSYDIAVDGSGQVTIAGGTTSSNLATANAYQGFLWGSQDGFIAKFNSSGTSLLYGTYSGSWNDDTFYALTVDSTGKAYATGYITNSSNSTSDAVVVGYNTTLSGFSSRIFQTSLAGNSSDVGFDITRDSSGNLYVTGTTNSSGLATAGAYDTSLAGFGTYDQFIWRLSSTGTSNYVSYYGGTGDEFGRGIAVDSSGYVYVTGVTTSATSIASAGAYDTSLSSTQDGYVAKFDLTQSGSAQRVWGTYFGGTGYQYSRDIAVSSDGGVWIAGYTTGTIPTTSGAYQTASGGSFDAFVAKFSTSGNSLDYSSYIGGSGKEYVGRANPLYTSDAAVYGNVIGGHGLALDASGNVYLAGTSYSTGMATAGAYDTTGDASGGDAFVLRLTESTAPVDLAAGIRINTDGGNDAYLSTSNGGAIFGGRSSLTLEASFEMEENSSIENILLSYAISSYDNELVLSVLPSGRIRLGIHNTDQYTTSAYPQLMDGDLHHIAVSWNGATGATSFYVDGVLVESFSGFATGVTLGSGGTLVLAQDQDSVGGGFNPDQAFHGVLHDMRVWSTVRTATEINDHYNYKFESATAGLIADWRMNGLTGAGNNIVTDLVAGNNLTLNHATGTGYSTSTPTTQLTIAENSSNGTSVGFLVVTDRVGVETRTYSLIDSAGGRFAIDSSTGEITVADSSLLNYESGSSTAITVLVTDGLGNTYSETFTILVTDVNDAPVITSNAGGAAASLSISELTTAVTTVTSTDADLPAQTRTYSISGGTDSARFTINSATGALAFIVAPSFAAPTDANSDNIYEVTVQASDGNGGTDTQALFVAVSAVSNTLVVTTTTDNNDSGITAGNSSQTIQWLNANKGADNAISLREAIIAANNTAGNEVISFNIAGAGVHTFNISTQLPYISDAVTIDGYTQSGSSANTLAVGSDAVLQIELTGTGASGSSGFGLFFDTNSGGSTVRGLIINNFQYDGIQIQSDNNTIAGNWIGLDNTGTTAIGNGSNAIRVDGDGNTIGGASAADRNVLSGNTSSAVSAGVYVYGATGGSMTGSANVIQGNYIGTNAAGTAAVGNTLGVMLHQAPGNLIGGSSAGEGNLISGNTTAGIKLRSSLTAGNLIQGNIIGLNASGSGAIANGTGVWVDSAASNNTLGGAGPNEGNTISGNTNAGVAIYTATAPAAQGIRILGNSIYGNGGLGIDLSTLTTGDDGVTANDGVKTSNQSNVLMDSPVITLANLQGGLLQVAGYVGTAPNQSIFANTRVELFISSSDASGYGEGQTYLGYLTTDSNGNFSGTLSVSGVTAASIITATATDTSGNTSEFGANYGVNVAPVNTVPGAQVVNEDTDLPIIGISVGDTDTNLQSVSVSVEYGALTVTLSGTATINSGANDSNTLTLTGTLADINNALASLIYRGSSNYNGADTLTLLSTDTGGLTALDTVAITVNPVNDAPVVTIAPATYSATEQTLLTLQGTGLSISDDSGGATIQATVSVDAGTLTTNAGTTGVAIAGSGTSTLTLTGTVAQINDLLAGNLGGTLTYIVSSDTPPASATLTLSVDDQGNSGAGGARSGSDTATISITAVNDLPVITSDGGGSTASISITENTTAVTTVTATDVDNGSLAYSIVGGADGSLFSINSVTGALSFASAPNREAPTDSNGDSIYDVTVQVSDGSGGSATQNISVTVTDLDEFDVGVIGDANAAANSVNENASNGSLVGLTAVAADSDATNNTITYSLDDDAGGRFAINAGSGVVTVADGSLLNREAAASHGIIVRATSTDGSFSTQSFTISVGDVDEFDVGAVTDTDGASAAVNENAPNGTAVGITASASDADATNNGVTYSLDDSAGGRFAIDSNSGVVSVADGTLLDREAAASHSIIVRATSADGSFSTLSFTVNVNDVNEFSLSAIADTNSSPNAVTENAANGAVVGITVLATDGDATTNSVVYTLDDSAGGRFTIDSSSGVVSVADGTLLDREAAASHSIVVRATSVDGSSSTQSFTISLTDTDELDVSAITDTDASANSVGENAANGSIVGITALATDADATNNAVVYSLDDSAGGRFAIDGATGVVSVADGTLLDREAAASHDIVVRATSADGSFSTLNFTVNVSDVDEFDVSALLDTDTAPNVIGENAADGSTVGITVQASDGDATASAITYSLDDSAGGRFAIDSTTGAVSVADSSLIRGDGGFARQIVARATSADGSFSTQSISINIGNINQAPTSAGGSVTTAEDTPYVFSPADFHFADADSGDSLQSVRIVSLPTAGVLLLSGSPVAAGQAINASDLTAGNLSFVPDANANGAAYADLAFTVSDGALESASASTLIINVTAVNDAPTITNSTLVLTAGESVILDTSNFGVSDVDSPSSSFVFYVSNVSHGRFELVSDPGVAVSIFSFNELSSGQVRFVREQGADAPSFEIQVSDGTSDSAPFSATVTLEPKPPLAFGDPALQLRFEEGGAAAREPAMSAPFEFTFRDASPVPRSAQTPFDNDLIGAMLPDGNWAPLTANVTITQQARPPVRVELVQMEQPGQYLLRQLEASSDQTAMADPGPLQWSDEQAGKDSVIDTLRLTGVALSVGVVWWALRATGLVGSVLASAPVWLHIDPLPVLAGDDDDDEDRNDWGVDYGEEAAREENAVSQLLRTRQAFART